MQVSHVVKDMVELSHTTPESICKEYLNHPLDLTLSNPGLVHLLLRQSDNLIIYILNDERLEEPHPVLTSHGVLGVLLASPLQGPEGGAGARVANSSVSIRCQLTGSSLCRHSRQQNRSRRG